MNYPKSNALCSSSVLCKTSVLWGEGREGGNGGIKNESTVSITITNSRFNLLERRHLCRPSYESLKWSVDCSSTFQSSMSLLKFTDKFSSMRMNACLQPTSAIGTTGSLNFSIFFIFSITSRLFYYCWFFFPFYIHHFKN